MRIQNQDQYQIPRDFLHSGSKNPGVVDQWTSAPEIQAAGSIIQTEIVDDPVETALNSSRAAVSMALNILGHAGVRGPERKPDPHEAFVVIKPIMEDTIADRNRVLEDA